ncbi:hypothetical protein M8J77_013462 [Diaphorina citri]|nr:hypothetical protein M8J77_013462 [Diaphorina citri]
MDQSQGPSYGHSQEVPSCGQSVDISQYVYQLEKRVVEQAQLINLLNDKIAQLEASGGVKSFSQVVSKNNSSDVPCASTNATKPPVLPMSAIGRPKPAPALSFIGSRKTDIATVPSKRYCQFFVTRINPDISSKKLGENLLSSVPDLSSVKCSRIKTKHSSYASFHVVVPEIEKSLVCSGDVWPEGTLVKQFVGKLLKNYVLETFSSDSPDDVPDSRNSTDHGSGVRSAVDSPNVVTGAGKNATKKTVPPKSNVGTTARGDYNLKTARWRDEEEAGMLVECSCASAISLAAVRVCESFNGLSLRQVNSLPNNHGVFLDLLFSDCSETSTHIAHDLLLENNFHHLAFCFDIPLKERVEFITEVVQIYDYAKCDLIELKSYLSKVDWSFILSQDDINSTVESFNNILLTGIELSTPHRIIHPSSFPRWFSGDLRRLIFVKKIAHLTFKRTNLRSDYDRFSSLRAHCCFLRDNCHKSHLKKVNKYVKSNPRYFWRYCDETRKVSGYPKDMFLQGVTSSTPQETANLFADSFSSVYMASDLPIPEYALHDLVDFNTCSVSESEVFKALSSLPPKFSSGPDCIPFFILKKCASDLARPLTLIFNKSLSTGVFPVTWKKSFVIPIFKSGNRRSTVTNLLSYQHDILQAIQSGQAVHSVYTDVAKAFDRVDTRFLIAKMRSYGLGDSILHWFSDYLAGRTQQHGAWFVLMATVSAVKGQFTRRKKELKVGLSLLNNKKDIDITDENFEQLSEVFNRVNEVYKVLLDKKDTLEDIVPDDAERGRTILPEDEDMCTAAFGVIVEFEAKLKQAARKY